MNKLLRIPFTDRALVIADDPHGQAEHYPGGLSFNTTATAEVVRGGEVIDRRKLGSGVITTAGINKWAAMLNAKQGPLYSATTTALGPYMLAAGTGTTAPAITDTGLQTAIGTTGVAYSSRSVNLLGFNVAGVAFGNGVYVAVGGTGGIATSTDAVNWTVRTSSAPTQTNIAVAFGNNTFVIACSSGMIYSTDNGIGWAPLVSFLETVVSVTFGNSVFVAASSKQLWSSSDGVTWTSRVSIGENNKQFYNVGWNSTYFWASSYWAGVAGSTATYKYFSTNGTSWNSYNWTNGYSYGMESTQSVLLNGRYYWLGSGNSIQLSATTPFSAGVLTSYSGGVPWNWVAVGNNIAVVVGNAGSIYTTTNLTSSSSDYTSRTSGTTANLTYVAYANNKFLAFAGGYCVVSSSDGTTWTRTRSATAAPTIVGTVGWFSGNSTYLMWGGSEFARSSDATTWYKQPAWFKFTTSYSNPYAVTEFGIFGGNTSNNLAGATLFDRRTFSAINVTGGDSINWYWGVTGAAGG